MGSKTKSGGKAPQEVLVEHRGALTPAEAERVTFQGDKPFLPKSALPKPAGCLATAKRAATFEGRMVVFAKGVLERQRISAEMARLLKAAQRGEVPTVMLPDQGTSLGKWLHSMPFAVQFSAVWLRLREAEGDGSSAYYGWYVMQKCPRNQRDNLAAWLKSSIEQASQAA